jgi:hypothetical protein
MTLHLCVHMVLLLAGQAWCAPDGTCAYVGATMYVSEAKASAMLVFYTCAYA